MAKTKRININLATVPGRYDIVIVTIDFVISAMMQKQKKRQKKKIDFVSEALGSNLCHRTVSLNMQAIFFSAFFMESLICSFAFFAFERSSCSYYHTNHCGKIETIWISFDISTFLSPPFYQLLTARVKYIYILPSGLPSFISPSGVVLCSYSVA